MKKRVGYVVALAAIAVAIWWYFGGNLAGNGNNKASGEEKPIAMSRGYGDTSQLQPHRLKLQQFLDRQMLGKDGVYTNYKETDEAAEVATGHETLSESAGLLLRYYALTGQKEAFDRVWMQTKRTFVTEAGFSYRYSPLHNKQYPLNAAVDDLRIIRSLHEAETVFGGDYGREADQYSARLYLHNVQNGKLFDFYDWTYKTTNDFITLCYADFQSLRLLDAPSKEKRKLEETLLEIVQGGYLSDAFPFYETRYGYATEKYGDHDGEINTVESLLTILHLAEIGEERPASVSYLKRLVEAGTLFGRYDREGQPVTDIQSTAAYAIAAMIGSTIGDQALYQASVRRMEQYRIGDESSPLGGSFGNEAVKEVYSFDNLTALLAYAY
ncbi:hypothetical protein [Paenibacillus glycanilyticus]|uniref:Glycosyl hydrolase n=1 Tax=Paenibacillus glycanilyticus TaxID=126569 RepID=A0ABQ6GN08_9BACL|nr:hypothetical protein [Paenibacillus glycanilyticus]GLX70387.1 hypothetical protein MU1_47330 [Paenibacillus glycanilyticus]